MDLFDCTPERLAERLSRQPELYNHAVLFLKGSRDLFAKQIMDSVDKYLAQLSDANDIARESDYFIFSINDTWAQEESGIYEDAYGVYQKVNNDLINKLGICTHDRPVSLEATREFFNKNKISQVFTTNMPSEGYCGLENSEDPSDGHIIEYRGMEKGEIESLKEEDITVTYL